VYGLISVRQEVSNDLVSKLSILVSTPLPPELVSAQQRSHVTYAFPEITRDGLDDCATLTLLESYSVIASSGTTGLRTWDAAIHFGAFLSTLDGRAHVQGKRVIELGAGTGLLSILCATWLGTKSVLATDGSTDVVDDIEENFFLNRLDTRPDVKARRFRWGQVLEKAEDDEEGPDEPFDVVLGADIVSRDNSRPTMTLTVSTHVDF
jgi:hypothetical protein